MIENFYQNLPVHINPIALKIGFFSLTWYSLMYLVTFIIIYLLLKWRVKNDSKIFPDFVLVFKNIENFFVYAIIGIIIGARLGYVFFYDPHFFLQNPWQIISPFNAEGNFVGIYGLSYHGGLIGIIIASIFFAKKYEVNFWRLADFIVPAIPLGYFFGRLGNFFNGELYGRLTEKSWGMYFLDENSNIMLRHPSQLYEALFEGIVLFLILWLLRNNRRIMGKLLPFYIFLYGLFRFVIEFFREPDSQIGLILGFLSLGQIFSLVMIAVSVAMCVYIDKKSKMF